VLIRRETPSDVSEVRSVVGAAFRVPGGSGDPVEVLLLDHLREGAEWLPSLSLVALSPSGGVVGYVVCTRAWVESTPIVGLGPLAVAPSAQGGGVGTALMHAVLGAAEALGVPAVGLLGSPAYYSRFGFRPGRLVGVRSPQPGSGDDFQVRLFVPDAEGPRGGFRYAQPFRDLGV
jgi:putative acetyltransferase